MSRVSQPGEDEVTNTKLLYITYNAPELFSKATQRTAQFGTGGEQEEAGALATVSHGCFSQYFPDNHLLMYLK